ncbi:MAG: hypothetical protein ACLFVW_03795 [Phycisphaerae bacterium]
MSPGKVFFAVFLTAGVLAASAFGQDNSSQAGDEQLWQYELTVPRPDRPDKAPVAHLWLPDGVETIRGLIIGDSIRHGGTVCRDPHVRKAAEDKKLGIVFFDPGLDAVFNWVENDSDKRLLRTLEKLAEETGHPELELVPWLTVGHSTGGIYARNVAYWKPDRVIGILHLKSGNLQDGLFHLKDDYLRKHPEAKYRTLAGVPFLAINGEYEEYGPKGGDLGVGLRSRYSLHAEDKSKRNQTQWVMIRMQLLDRRRKNPDNLMALVVERDGGHVSWNEDMSKLSAQFVRSAADARIPEDAPTGEVVQCKRVSAEDGWLMDPDIKDPEHAPAPYEEYPGDKTLAFWVVDKDLAEALWEYHKSGEWKDPDPTADEPVEQRYYPPEILQDPVDTLDRDEQQGD